MINYKYTAIDNKGKKVYGEMKASDEVGLRGGLKDEGKLLIKYKEIKGNRKTSHIEIFKSNKKLDSIELSNLCRQLGIVVSSGVSVTDSLEILAEQSTDKTFKSEIKRLYNGIVTGSTMSDVMYEKGSKFPELLAGMVSTGESSGTLDKIFKSMADYYMREGSIKKKIKSALIYPTLLLVMAVGLVIGFLKFVLPSILEIIVENGVELPAITKFVIWLSGFVGKYYLIIIAVLIIMIPLTRAFFKSKRGRLIKDTVLMKIPVLKKAIVNVETSRFSQGIGLLMTSGFPLVKGLELLAKSATNVLAEKSIHIAIQGVQRGENLTDNLRKGDFFDGMFLQMFLVGEQTGAMGTIASELSDYYGREVEISIARAMSLIEPILMVVIGCIIGFLVVSIALPMISMYESFE